MDSLRPSKYTIFKNKHYNKLEHYDVSRLCLVWHGLRCASVMTSTDKDLAIKIGNSLDPDVASYDDLKVEVNNGAFTPDFKKCALEDIAACE